MSDEPFDEADAEEPDASEADIAPVVNDVREFFLDPKHWIYTSKGTPSDISPNFVYHIGQLEVLFEDRHFHYSAVPIDADYFVCEEGRTKQL